jgi:cytidine deaminase
MAGKKELKGEVTVYKDKKELSDIEQELLATAETAAQKAYAPYSKFMVGAAVLLTDGTVASGNNQENRAYPVGLCAERVALFHASSQHPDTAVKMIAITAMSLRQSIDEPVTPCGACRQAIAEYEQKFKSPIRIIMSGEKGEIYACDSIKVLLPLMFDSKSL